MNLLEKRLKNKYSNENLTVLKYTRMKDNAEVKCNNCGQIYKQKAENFLRKTKTCFCLNCKKKLIGKNKYQQKINDKYPNEDIIIVEFNGAKGKLIVKCNKCKNYYSYEYGENILTNNKKRVCSHCFPNKREAMINTIIKFKAWSKNNKYFKDFIFDKKINSNTLIESICVKCGQKNYKTVYDYMRGRKCSCMGNNVLLSEDEFRNRIGDSYELLSEYKGLNNPVLIKHKNCGFIFKKSNGKNISCPRCKNTYSKGEQEIYYYLKNNNIDFVKEYTVSINNHSLRFDFYLPFFDIYIEFQGIQHYKPVEFFGGKNQFEKQVLYDNLKRQYAKNKLLEIKYNENIKEKINSFLIKLNE